MTDEQYSTQSYTDDIDIKTFKDWDLDLSNLPPLLKDTISLIKKVQADKYNLKQHPSLSNLKLNFRFSQFEIKNIIRYYSTIQNSSISPQEFLISYSEVQILDEAILNGCRALVIAMDTQPKLIPQYIVPAISLLMQCEKEAYDESIQPDNIYRSFFANHIFLLLFKCKLKIHQTNSEDTHLDEEVIKVLSEAYGPEGIPTISILDEVLLGWIDVYMEYCLYSKQWDMIFLLHDGLLQALVTSHQGNLRTNEAIDFKLPRHLVIDKVAATLPLYQHLLTGNLVFPILISLYIAIGYEYCTTILNWKTYPGFIIPVRNKVNNLKENNGPSHGFFEKEIPQKLGICLQREEENEDNKNTNSNTLLFDTILKNQSELEEMEENYEHEIGSLYGEDPEEAEKKLMNLANYNLEAARLLIHKGLECFGALSTMSDNWLTDLDRKLVSWNAPFDISLALVLCGADFFLALGHAPNSYSLFSELVDKLELAWKARTDPKVSLEPSWIQNFGGTRDGTYLDIYKIFTPNLAFRGIYGLAVILMAYDFFFEASIEFSTILATFSTECITQCTLLEEDIISKKEYYDDSMYGLNQNLQLAFVTNKQFAARCLKKLLICLEMLASKNPTNFKYTEWMLILIQFGWPYWEFAFDNVIVKRLEEYPVEEFPILLKYIYEPNYARKLMNQIMKQPKFFPIISHKFAPGSKITSEILVEMHAIIDNSKELLNKGDFDPWLQSKLVEFLKTEMLVKK